MDRRLLMTLGLAVLLHAGVYLGLRSLPHRSLPQARPHLVTVTTLTHITPVVALQPVMQPVLQPPPPPPVLEVMPPQTPSPRVNKGTETAAKPRPAPAPALPVPTDPPPTAAIAGSEAAAPSVATTAGTVAVTSAGAGGGGADPAGAEPGPMAVTRVDEPPRALRANAPTYPEAAERRGEAATVHLVVTLSAEGRVTEVDASCHACDPAFVTSARQAVQSWQFAPARWHGRAVAVRFAQDIEFTLPER